MDQWLNLSSISNFISWGWIWTGFCPCVWPYSFSNYCWLPASRYEICTEWERDFVQRHHIICFFYLFHATYLGMSLTQDWSDKDYFVPLYLLNHGFNRWLLKAGVGLKTQEYIIFITFVRILKNNHDTWRCYEVKPVSIFYKFSWGYILLVNSIFELTFDHLMCPWIDLIQGHIFSRGLWCCYSMSRPSLLQLLLLLVQPRELMCGDKWCDYCVYVFFPVSLPWI